MKFLEQDFSTSALENFYWAGKFSVAQDCPVHRRILSSSPDFYSLSASRIPASPQAVTTKSVSRQC